MTGWRIGARRHAPVALIKAMDEAAEEPVDLEPQLDRPGGRGAEALTGPQGIDQGDAQGVRAAALTWLSRR